MNCSAPGFPVLHYLLEFYHTHIHWFSDAIQPSHDLLPPSPALNLYQHQSLFQWVSSASGGQSIRVLASASVLLIYIQGWYPLGFTSLIYVLSKGLWRVFSSTIAWKHQFFGAQPSLWSSSHVHTRPLGEPQLWVYSHLSAKWRACSLTRCLGWSQLSFQGAGVFYFHGCSHHLQWFWSPRK